jgi:hypothetical protein
MLTLPVLALLSATLFAGAAAYITIIEHPARLTLEDGPMLAQWQPSYRRALPIQAGLAVLGGVVGLIAFYQLRDWQWLVGSVVLLANWPFTLLVIMPTNKRLLATPVQEAGAESRQMLLRWGKLHNVRSALGVLAVLLFAWGLLVR